MISCYYFSTKYAAVCESGSSVCGYDEIIIRVLYPVRQITSTEHIYIHMIVTWGMVKTVLIPSARSHHRNQCWWHDDVIKWKHFPRYWPFVRGIHRSPVNSPHKGQWRGALMLSLICVWINGWVNNREAGDLRRYCAHCDVIVMMDLRRHMTSISHNE